VPITARSIPKWTARSTASSETDVQRQNLRCARPSTRLKGVDEHVVAEYRARSVTPAQWLAVACLLHAAALGVAWWHVSSPLLLNGGSGGRAVALGRLAGLLVGSGVLLQLVLVSRLPGIEPSVDLVFASELRALSPRCHFVLSRYTENTESTGTGETNVKHERGRIDLRMLARLVPDVQDREVFICGPQPMMRAVAAALPALQVRESSIHYEQFA